MEYWPIDPWEMWCKFRQCNPNTCYGLTSWAFIVIVLIGEHHKTYPMISQHWFKYETMLTYLYVDTRPQHYCARKCVWIHEWIINKANLRDLIAVTGLVILLKLDWNRQFFSPCDLQMWCMASKNYGTPLLHYIKLCASSQTLGEFKLDLLSRNAELGSKSANFCPMWPWNLTDDLEKQ